MITELNAEGHELSAGVAGENITVCGIDWRKLHAGMIVEIGDMRCQLSAPADPCAKIRRWFSDNDSGHIDHFLHPGEGISTSRAFLVPQIGQNIVGRSIKTIRLVVLLACA